MIHSTSLVQTKSIGSGTRIWAFVNVLAGATIGDDCNICDHVFIENDVKVGDRVTVKCGVQLWDGITLEDDVFVGPNVTFTNDKMPRSKQYLSEYPRTVVRKGASIGANATILPGLTIGANASVGAGAVVTRSVPANAIVVGNPAGIVGYVDSNSQKVHASVAGSVDTEVYVRGVRLISFMTVEDLRGNLCAAEVGGGLPFVPRRMFMVYDVPHRKVRGEHAHRECHQLLIAGKGSVNVVVDDGVNRQEFILDSPSIALHIQPMVWAIQYKYTQDAVLTVLASDEYSAEDYIRDYDTFTRMVRSRG